MYYARALESRLRGPVSRNKVRLLFGARQTGKTALLSHLLESDETRFINLQEPELRRRFEADPGAFGREVRALPRAIKNVVVDEVQKVPELLEQVQALHDSSPRARQFFLTGSSARRLRSEAANLLPGRAHAWRLFPVCRWEVDAAASLALPAPATLTPMAHPVALRRRLFPAQDLSLVLRFGCLPGVRAESAHTAEATLRTYVDTYLEEEIRREAAVRHMGPFLVFLRLAAEEAGGQTNVAKLSQQSGVPASTVKNFYQVLVDSFVGYFVPPYARRTRRRLQTTPRFCMFDVGVRNAAAELPLDAGLIRTQGGALLEQWVGQELVARASYLGAPHQVSFWRTATGAEVDWVWTSAREDVPIEVKWTDRPRPGDARHLETFLDEFPKRARRGLLVCRCEEPQALTDRVTALPWHLL